MVHKSQMLQSGGGGGGVTTIQGESGAITLTSSGGTVVITTPTSSVINLESTGGTPAGSDTWLQFNNAGVFGADSQLSWFQSNLYTHGFVVTDAANTIQAFNGITPVSQILGNTPATNSFWIAAFNATAANSSEIGFYRSRSTNVGTATVIQSGDALAKITAYGAQQTGTFSNQKPAAQWRMESDGVVTSGAGGDMPGRHVWATTPDSSGALIDRMSLNNFGQFVIGSGASPLSFGGVAPGMQLQGQTQANGALAMSMFNSGTNPEFIMYRSRNGTIGSATVVQNGDSAGRFNWYVASQTGTFSSQVQIASIRAMVDSATITSTSVAGRLEFGVTAVGGFFAATGMTLFSTGRLNLPVLTASQFVQTDSSKNLVSIDLFGGSNTWAGANTFSGSGAILAMTNNSAVTFDSTSFIKDSFGTSSIDPYNRSLSDSASTIALTYGTGNRVLWDDSGNESADWNARQLANTFGNIVYDYANGWVYYDSGTIFISVNDGELRDALGIASLNASQRKAYDPTGAIVMMDWNMMQNSSAFLSFDTSGNPFFTQSIHAQQNLYVTGLINGNTLNANGVVGTDASKNLISIAAPTIAANGRGTGKTAAFSLGAYSVPAVDTSFYVSANVLITASTLHSFTVTCSYTDESNTARVLTLNFSQLTGAFVTTLTNALGASAYEGVAVEIRCKASTTITIQSTGTFTTVTYNIEERIISLGA